MSRLKKALEKAKKDLPEIQLYDIEKPNAFERDDVEQKSIFQPETKPETKIDDSRTKIQPISHDVLRDNKIFALFTKYKVNDQIKTLRTQVLKKLEKIGSNIIMITSANPGEGKTFTSINLGVSIAQELDRTVLIVDADLKNPAKDHYDFATDFFSMKVETGLADVLSGTIQMDDALINPGIEKLTILPGGNYLHNSAELLGSPQMELLIKEIKTRFKDRIVIFDTPAVLSCADPIQLTKFVENVLFVVEEEKTSAEDIRQSMKLLSDINIIGMIINKSKLK
jgi:non-specific protein-tyrosine kinase